MELQAIVDDFLRNISSEQLRHRHLHRGVFSRDDLVHRVVGQHPSRTNRREVLGKLVLPDLELDDWTIERLSLLPERDGILDSDVHALHGHEGAAETLALEVLHDVDEATVEHAEQISLWNSAVIEVNLAGVDRSGAELIELTPDRESWGVGRKEDQRDSAVAILPGAHSEGDEVGKRCVGNVGLRAIDDEVVAVFLGRGPDCRDV